MRYTVGVDLDLPRDRVVELFDSTENLYKWQEGLQSFEPLEGEPGQKGSTAKMSFLMGKRKLEMVETIDKRNLPDELDTTYEARGCLNVCKNRFIELGPDKTRWEADQQFKFSGPMKLFAWMMPGAFKKVSLKYMTDFKAFAEEGKDVRDAS